MSLTDNDSLIPFAGFVNLYESRRAQVKECYLVLAEGRTALVLAREIGLQCLFELAFRCPR